MEVDETPLLEEGMQSYNGADVARKPLATLWGRQICHGLFSVHLDDRVAEVHVGDGILVWELVAEELGQILHLQLVDLIDVEPGTAAWDD